MCPLTPGAEPGHRETAETQRRLWSGRRNVSEREMGVVLLWWGLWGEGHGVHTAWEGLGSGRGLTVVCREGARWGGGEQTWDVTWMTCVSYVMTYRQHCDVVPGRHTELVTACN